MCRRWAPGASTLKMREKQSSVWDGGTVICIVGQSRGMSDGCQVWSEVLSSLEIVKMASFGLTQIVMYWDGSMRERTKPTQWLLFGLAHKVNQIYMTKRESMASLNP